MLKYEKIWPPAIPYKLLPKKGKKAKKNGKLEKKDDESESDKEDNTKYQMFEVKFDPDDPDSDGYTQKVAVFGDGHPEEWVEEGDHWIV